MKFIQTKLQGAYFIELDKLSDERGFFAWSFDSEEYIARGLNPNLVQCNGSYNHLANLISGKLPIINLIE